MTANLLTAPVQACIFVLGCALIHAARAQAEIVTRWLAAAAVVMASLTLIEAAWVWAPAPQDRHDEITTYAAIAGHPPETP